VIPRPEPNGGAAVHGIQRWSDEQKGTSSSPYPSSPRRTAPRSDELDGGPEPTCSTMAQRAVTCHGERHPARGSGRSSVACKCGGPGARKCGVSDLSQWGRGGWHPCGRVGAVRGVCAEEARST
jgi:hypothetical protein